MHVHVLITPLLCMMMSSSARVTIQNGFENCEADHCSYVIVGFPESIRLDILYRYWLIQFE